MVVPFASWRTSVHPLGAVKRGAPRAAIAITSTSPGCAPAGAGIVSDEAVGVGGEARAVERDRRARCWPRRASTGAAALCAERCRPRRPRRPCSCTSSPGAAVVSENDVVAGVPIGCRCGKRGSRVTPTLSVEADQERSTRVEDAAVAVRPAGTLGADVSDGVARRGSSRRGSSGTPARRCASTTIPVVALTGCFVDDALSIRAPVQVTNFVPRPGANEMLLSGLVL